MNIEEIQKFLSKQVNTDTSYVKISFKKRDPMYGLFIKTKDFDDLKAKNFWRIVTQKNIDGYNKSGDINLARIFSGSDFSKLTPYSESFE